MYENVRGFTKPPHLAVICRVCNLPVKRSAVLCDQCSLIAHSKCAHNAPPVCNLRAQLLLYAQYAEKGSSTLEPLGVLSDGVSTPGSSLNSGRKLAPSPATVQPPTTHKILTAFKRSRLSSSLQPAARSTTSVDSIPAPRERHTSLPPPNRLKQEGEESARPLSTNGASRGPSNLRGKGQDSSADNSRRSAGTKSESITSRVDGATRMSKVTRSSVISVGSGLGHEEVNPPGIPDGPPSPPKTSKRRTSKRGDGCLIQ